MGENMHNMIQKDSPDKLYALQLWKMWAQMG